MTHILCGADAGGGLLDLGVYPLTFATSLLGLPTDFRVLDTPAESGVDAQLGIVLQHTFLFSDTVRENIRFGIAESPLVDG